MNDQLKITPVQREIIIGKLLGDGHLETANGKTYRLKIEHSYNQKEYVDRVYEKLYSLTIQVPKLRFRETNGKVYKKYWFTTMYSGSFRFFAQQFYKNRRKVVPRLIYKWLTSLAFAVWFMDDGSIKSKECRAKILNTQGFDKADIERLRNAILSNFGIHTSLRKQKEEFQIYIPASEVDKLKGTIGRYVLPSMRYKLG